LKQCQLCNEETIATEKQIEAVILDMIRKNNPQWVEADGACEKCITYYKNLNRMVKIEE